MASFIEVTASDDTNYLINVSHIISIDDVGQLGTEIHTGPEENDYHTAMESYGTIKCLLCRANSTVTKYNPQAR